MVLNGHLEICSRPQAIENSRQCLLLRTDILQKTVVGYLWKHTKNFQQPSKYLLNYFIRYFSWGCGRTRFSALLLMVWSSTCLVMSSRLWIVPSWFLKSTSAGACTCTLCWLAVITAKQIFVKKYRTMVIIMSKSRFGSISIDRISTASSFSTCCSLRS